MALRTYWIADSGGSKTEWAFCKDGDVVKILTTKGLHPRYFSSRTEEDREQLKALLEPNNAPVYFYGAGCARPDAAKQVEQELLMIGFSHVDVYPDALGACRSLCGSSPGVVAILGTGSIVLVYDGQTITRRFGGFGPLIGDEGSGLHFARLVVRAYLSRQTGEEIYEQLEAVLGTQDAVLSKLSGDEATQWLAGLGQELAHLPLEKYHRMNLEQWIESWLVEKPDCRELVVTGSYGAAQQDLLRLVLDEHGIRLADIIPTPIAGLINYHFKTITGED